MTVIDASGMYYKELNALLRQLTADGITEFRLTGICGQRYIATDLPGELGIEIQGTPGNDLGAFMDGPKLVVRGNVQDGCGNTMNSGEIVVHGRAGDILGMAVRGGNIFIRDGAGYRCAIHMKEYREKRPLLVIGGSAQDFFGEYMAGGTAVLLCLNGPHTGRFVGTGMHGGTIYVRGEVEEYQLGKEVGASEPDAADMLVIGDAVRRYAEHFGMDARHILESPFTKLAPVSTRPYGNLYTY
ncbi:MAG: GltB/FmdC/FwdC-like GXGXG domain-containing protein [Armatimonadota bacterium]